MAVSSATTPDAARPSAAPPGPRRRIAFFSLATPRVIALIVVLVCIAPTLAILFSAGAGLRSGVDAVDQSLVLQSVSGTLLLILVGGGAATVFGAGAALLVSLCRFPGRALFEWLLVLPLAAPAYALAYSYSSLTWSGGPIHAPLTGWVGAAFIYAVGFYPYVYLAARASFANQSVSAVEAARTLGARPMRAVLAIALPLAYPGVAAGAALVAMEIAADFGAAVHFGATTITTGVYFRARGAHQDPQLANEMAALLLIAAIVLLWLERSARGRKQYAGGANSQRAIPRFSLPIPAAGAAIVFCSALTFFGALLPMAWLARLTMLRSTVDLAGLTEPLLNSVALAAIGATVTLVLAAIVAGTARSGVLGRLAGLAASAGYAAPGIVIALGALSLFGFARQMGWVGGLGAPLALTLLVWTYAARFSAPGAQPIEAGMARITRSISGAARTLGAGAARRYWRIDLPLAGPSIIAAGIIVFVEILKELPATLLLRPIDFDTLAVRAHFLASDERMVEAAPPALLLTLVGLIPIVALSTRIERARG